MKEPPAGGRFQTSGDDALADALGAMIAEARLQTALLEKIADVLCPPNADAGTRRLLEVISGWIGESTFTAADLIDHAQFEPALKDAIVQSCGALSARRVGKLLRRIQGQDFAGLSITRERDGREGIVWALTGLRV